MEPEFTIDIDDDVLVFDETLTSVPDDYENVVLYSESDDGSNIAYADILAVGDNISIDVSVDTSDDSSIVSGHVEVFA